MPVTSKVRSKKRQKSRWKPKIGLSVLLRIIFSSIYFYFILMTLTVLFLDTFLKGSRKSLQGFQFPSRGFSDPSDPCVPSYNMNTQHVYKIYRNAIQYNILYVRNTKNQSFFKYIIGIRKRFNVILNSLFKIKRKLGKFALHSVYNWIECLLLTVHVFMYNIWCSLLLSRITFYSQCDYFTKLNYKSLSFCTIYCIWIHPNTHIRTINTILNRYLKIDNGINCLVTLYLTTLLCIRAG